MSNFFLRIFIILQIFSVSALANEGMLQDPKEILKNVTDAVISRLVDNKDKIAVDKNFVNELIEEVLVPHVDFQEMAKLVVGRNWLNANEQDKQDFTAEFKKLVIKTYAFAFRSYKDERVEIIGERFSKANENLVEVRTLIKQNSSPDVEVNYRLKKENKKWLVYDMSVEGISLVKNFRAQFAETLKQKSLKDLTSDLAKRNDQAEKHN